MKRVIIVGCGFAGLSAAKTLKNRSDVNVTIVDRRNYHLFQPLLYQVATAGLTSADIAYPIRSVFRRSQNISVLLGSVNQIDIINKKISTDSNLLSFDYLILAAGSEHSYFSRPDWEERAPGLKSLEQAIEIRRRLLLAFEEAERETDEQLKQQWLNFIIVGGGPTGVELAGAIAEIGRHTLRKDFRHVDPAKSQVLLIEGGDRLLSSFPQHLAAKAANDLEQMGVKILTNTRVSEIDSEGVKAGDLYLRAKTVIWAAGVRPSALAKQIPTPRDESGRVIVNECLCLPAHPNVFVIGDLANVSDKRGQSLPGLAPVAMQEGVHAAKSILADINGVSRKPFHYFDKGQLATIGRKKAVVQIGKLSFNGWFAWLIWIVVHIHYLIGFRNKLFVILQWAWSYITFKRGARLIVEHEWRLVNASSDRASPA